MQFAFLLALVASAAAQADPSASDVNFVVNLGVGPSVPASDPAQNINSIIAVPGGNLSRKNGGEVLGFGFADPDTNKIIDVQVEKIRLIGYSKSGSGKVLVHSVNALPAQPERTFWPLFQYASLEPGARAENHDSLVMLQNGDSVSFTPAQPLTLNHFLFTLEGFADDDASVDVQVELSPGTPKPLAVSTARIPNQQPSQGGGSGGSGGGSSTGPTGGSSSGSSGGHSGGGSSGGTGGGSSGGGHSAGRCDFKPYDPGCPLFCQLHPMDANCTAPGGGHCGFKPYDPGCPLFCQLHPMDSQCTAPGGEHCGFKPYDPGCPLSCQLHPMDEHCH